MTEKKRPPRYSDIIELSHKPPLKKPAISPFTLAYDADEKRRMQSITPADLPAIPPETSCDAKSPVDAKSPEFDAKFDAKTESLDAKTSKADLASNQNLTSSSYLASRMDLTSKKETYPSWDVPRLFVRIPRELQDRLRFLGLSRGVSLQDTVLLAIQSLLASEGLTPNHDLASNGIWRPTDQMTDDAAGIQTTSSVPADRPEDLMAYYAKWAGNPIRQNDWQALKAALSYSPLAIKTGILLSILRTKTRVNSFKYCLGAIDEAARAGVVNSPDYLRYLEQKIEKGREGK